VRGDWTGVPDRGPVVLCPRGATKSTSERPAAFLDRDGTLNEAVADPDSGTPESPLRVADVRLLPGAAAAARELAAAGYALVCASNQPAAAKGKVSIEELLSVHERLIELLAEEKVEIEASLLCLHHPDGIVEALAGRCDCRKPHPGMLLDAAAALEIRLEPSWMLGDTDTDVAAGRAAGCRTVLIEYPGSVHKRSGQQSPDLRAADLPAGVAQLLDPSG
jgi:D-glycero-D-manno-heptose 1,7-bisphosphate phosphatase